MDLFEHQGKELFERHGIKLIPRLVASSPAEAREAAGRLGPVAVKAQVQIGGRGKGGGIVLARTPREAETAARKMLEDGFQGMPVPRVLLERLVDIDREFYMAITLDRTEKRYVAMTSSEGGVDIEEVASTHPEAIRRVAVDPLLGLKSFQVRRLVGGFPEEAREGTAALLSSLYDVLINNDATLVEVNPLALLKDGRVVPLDAKVTIDDNALGRHPDLADYAKAFRLDPTEARAREKGLQYVKLDGEVGIIGNGAGLVMATLDVVQQAGGSAANFLDVGGGAGADLMATSLEVILSDPAVRSVLINIFGGITRGDVVATGILEALQRVTPTVQIVVRLDGTNAAEGRTILAEANHPRIVPAETMLEAAQRASELA
ncbi:MAG TPA: ADP-forming succinate--CoA ligase subunit beta, partial [Actinomycetota bacterium]|nr:ADP-forming succinate--CoA ligase subunit beta [Actinomycetota bacterium]